MSEIKKGEHKLKEEKRTIYKIKMFYRSRNDLVKLFDDYSSILSEVKYETTRGKGCLKQMLQRLTISLAQIAVDTFENLINEILQIMYSCTKRKKLLKNYMII